MDVVLNSYKEKHEKLYSTPKPELIVEVNNELIKEFIFPGRQRVLI